MTTDKQKRKEAIAQANNRCPRCGAVHEQTIRTSERNGNLWVTYLQLAHPDHDPWNPNARTEVLCNGCHMSKDGPLHAASARKTRELRKNSKARRYQRNSVSNHELVRIARILGIDLTYAADELGGSWYRYSEISSGSYCEIASALNQALYDLVATYRELAHRYVPQEEWCQDTMVTLCIVGDDQEKKEREHRPSYE